MNKCYSTATGSRLAPNIVIIIVWYKSDKSFKMIFSRREFQGDISKMRLPRGEFEGESFKINMGLSRWGLQENIFEMSLSKLEFRNNNCKMRTHDFALSASRGEPFQSGSAQALRTVCSRRIRKSRNWLAMEFYACCRTSQSQANVDWLRRGLKVTETVYIYHMLYICI